MLAVTAVFIAYYMFFAPEKPHVKSEAELAAEKYCNGPGSYTDLPYRVLDENNEWTTVVCIKSKMVGKSTSVSSQ